MLSHKLGTLDRGTNAWGVDRCARVQSRYTPPNETWSAGASTCIEGSTVAVHRDQLSHPWSATGNPPAPIPMTSEPLCELIGGGVRAVAAVVGGERGIPL